MKQISVLDFGARGDGLTDDTLAIQRALDSGAETVCFPMGIYPVSETLLVHSDTRIEADRSAKIILRSTRRKKQGEFLLSNADPEGGNRNITLSGGIWDGNNTAPEHEKPDLFEENGYSGAMLNFVGVTGLALRDVVLANSVTFYVRMSRVHDFVIENVDFVSDKPGWNQDGIHFGGDVRRGTVRNIRALSDGQTTDDMIAFNADDSIVRVENRGLVRDGIEDVTVENVFARQCHTVFRMLSVNAPIRNIRIRNVFAGYRCYGINADAARYCRTPLFAEEEYPEGCGCLENILVENMTCTATGDRPAIALESMAHNVEIRNFRLIPSPGGEALLCGLEAKNLKGQKITADGETCLLREKEDKLILGAFSDLRLEKLETEELS